MLTLIRCN